MGKKLIIAEKPSVANDIARALGGFTRHGDYFESSKYVLSSAIGHLVEIVAPDKCEVKRGKWSLVNLPVIPPHFDLRPIERTEDRLKLLTRLMKRKDVDGLVNACDAGREGELIFRYIVDHADVKKPMERLWLQSMTPGAIREGFASLRPDSAMRPLADAARSRSESDWLIGINGTRAMTAFNSKDGGFYKTTVGRVQTPTLAILVEREERIRDFVARDYWEVEGTFAGKGGEYRGRWFDEAFDRNKKADDPDLRPDRIWTEKQAEAIRGKCMGKPGIVTEESKPTTQAPPMLYDLTSLQREANSRFGFSAKMTLSIAQALYERHKVLTYPRTDSRALPEDYVATVKSTLEMLRGEKGKRAGRKSDESPDARGVAAYAPFADRVLREGWVRPNKRIFNNEKVSDHFAIIPTLQAPKHLTEPEAKLYDMVTKRFLAVFFPAAEYLVTTRITRVADEPFKSEGRVMMNAGWLAVYGREAESGDTPTLAPVPDGKADTVAIDVNRNQTKPPARYTEATLLSAMEGAGKLVEDEELREAMREKGLGTPATRSAIIEGLIQEEYVVREGRDLHPTAKAFDLLFALHKFGIEEISSPELTGDWEFKLKQMEQGKLKRAAFMDHIEETARDLVARIKRAGRLDEPISTLKVKCPNCGAKLVENYKKFTCTKCDFAIWKVIAGRRIEAAEAEALITTRSIGPLQGFRSRMGRRFAAMLKLKDDLGVELDFGQGGDAEREAEPVDFSGKAALGKCPKCGANVYDHELAYVCEKSVGPGRTCDFRTGKIILQRPIEIEQVKKLLATGKTDLLHRFVSKKGRPFSAFLARQPDGRIGFEFAPRERKTPIRAAAKADAKTPARPEAPAAARAAARSGAQAAKPRTKPARAPAPKPAGKSTPRRAAKRG
ncbi:MAG: DNA topoisomerase III [Burkholderiales bacterium]|nr:DNA topoisomerase III [Burkholderiales bacterium]